MRNWLAAMPEQNQTAGLAGLAEQADHWRHRRQAETLELRSLLLYVVRCK